MAVIKAKTAAAPNWPQLTEGVAQEADRLIQVSMWVRHYMRATSEDEEVQALVSDAYTYIADAVNALRDAQDRMNAK